MPGSLASWPGHLLTAVVVVALLAGGMRVVRAEPALAVAAAVGFVLAGAAHLPGGADALGWAVAHLPGAGLLRDGQKWLMPYVVVVVTSAGVAAARAEAALRRRDADLGRLVAGALVLAPGGADARRRRSHVGGRRARHLPGRARRRGGRPRRGERHR